MQRYHLRTILASSLLAVSVVACGDGPTGTQGTTRLTVLLTDDPGDIEYAWVEVSEITLQGSGGTITLLDAPTGLIEMTQLASGGSEPIVEGLEIPAGTYTQLRFVIGRGALQVGGQIYASEGVSMEELEEATGTWAGTLKCPSCAQSGLKVNLPGGSITLESGQQIVVVDFDVSQSYGRQAGKSGMWVMHPVMQASEFTVTGSILGTVSIGTDAGGAPLVSFPLSCGGGDLAEADLLSLFLPRATSGELVKSGTTDGDGSYRILFVPPGSWEMGHASAIELGNGDSVSFSDVGVTPGTVEVTSDGVAMADYVIGGAACVTAGG
ncbi:MAG: DUF4382 domain-containing protein [Gemmatimonadota bacterium]